MGIRSYGVGKRDGVEKKYCGLGKRSCGVGKRSCEVGKNGCGIGKRKRLRTNYGGFKMQIEILARM